MEELKFPIRINHYLALRKVCSRRQADELIAQGKIKINGRLAKIGQKVTKEDTVTVDQITQSALQKNRIFLAYYKPINIATLATTKNEKGIGDILKFKTKVFPIGRLDKDSHGLILLTNDGRITDRMLNPKYEHEKEYLVKLNKKIRPGFIRRLGEGVELENYQAKPAMAEALSDTLLRIVLTEGKNRQIRKMCAAFGYEVRDLKRIRIMNIRLGNLRPNEYRILKGQELNEFLKTLDLSD